MRNDVPIQRTISGTFAVESQCLVLNSFAISSLKFDRTREGKAASFSLNRWVIIRPWIHHEMIPFFWKWSQKKKFAAVCSIFSAFYDVLICEKITTEKETVKKFWNCDFKRNRVITRGQYCQHVELILAKRVSSWQCCWEWNGNSSRKYLFDKLNSDVLVLF